MMLKITSDFESKVHKPSFSDQFEAVDKNFIYKKKNNSKGYVLMTSKMYNEGENEKFWFSFRDQRVQQSQYHQLCWWY